MLASVSPEERNDCADLHRPARTYKLRRRWAIDVRRWRRKSEYVRRHWDRGNPDERGNHRGGLTSTPNKERCERSHQTFSGAEGGRRLDQVVAAPCVRVF